MARFLRFVPIVCGISLAPLAVRAQPASSQQSDTAGIRDVYGNAASAMIVASDWIDYLHLAKWNGRWVIVNVLWELKPQAPKK